MGNYSDITNSLVTIVYVVMGFVFLIIGATVLFINRDNLYSKKLQEEMRVYFEGVRTSSFLRMIYNLTFLIRRLITAVVLVMLTPYPYFQSNTLVVLSFANIWYLTEAMPLKEENVYEIFNEVFIYICSLLMANMLDASLNSELNDLRGWVFIVMASTNLIINMTLTVYSSFKDIITSRKEAMYKKRAKRAIQNKLFELKSQSGNKQEIQDLTDQLDLIEAIRTSRKWMKHRKWLIKNKVNFENFKEEIEF